MTLYERTVARNEAEGLHLMVRLTLLGAATRPSFICEAREEGKAYLIQRPGTTIFMDSAIPISWAVDGAVAASHALSERWVRTKDYESVKRLVDDMARECAGALWTRIIEYLTSAELAEIRHS